MGKRNLAVTAAAVCSGLLITLSAGVVRSAEEASADRLRPGYIPDPQGYWKGDPFDPGKVGQTRTPQATVDARAEQQRQAKTKLGVEEPKQILFGDMHVHSTYSVDAFRFNLPLMQGSRGAYPPADACDYARYISQLDFYWITDHAEAYTPNTGKTRWRPSASATR